jgi:hypothetical protein
MGKSVATPEVPDYASLAKQQGQENRVAAEQSSRLSNPNMYTPFGTQTVSYSDPIFDQARYDADQAAYNAKVNRDQFYEVDNGNYGGDSNGWAGSGETYFNDQAYQRALAQAGSAPDRNQYMSGGGIPTVTQTLTPEAQATLDAQMRVQRAMAGLSETGIGNAKQMLSTPFAPTSTSIAKDFADYGRAMNEVPLTTDIDTSNFSQMPLNAGTTAQDLILQRLSPTIQAGDKSFAQTLANQGLAPGTEAYNTAFRNREMSKNDLYSQAALQGINLDMGARQQQLNEALGIGGFENQAQLNRAGLYNSALGQDFAQGLSRAQFGNQAQQQQLAQDLTLRGQPMNEIIGLLGGSQIQLPQFAGYTPSQVSPTPTMAGAQAGYQAQLGAANAQNAANSQAMSGLFGLGAAGLMAPAGTFGGLFGAGAGAGGIGSLASGLTAFSDRRLKTNIKQIGTADNGLNVYSYNYVWGGPTQLGYMADEVEKLVPEAVGESHGYKTVNYGMI